MNVFKIFACVGTVFLLLGCDSNSALPKFAAACSSNGGPLFYRAVSDPSNNRIYFGSIINERNINATQISGNVSVTDDFYDFTLFDFDLGNKKARFERKNGTFIIYNPPEMHRLSGRSISFKCQRLSDDKYGSTLQLLKQGRAMGEAAMNARTQSERNRPKQF
jgi:hypothetical protein